MSNEIKEFSLVDFDDPVLREKSKEVSIIDDNVRNELNSMLKTMYNDNGVGLAAPQVGISKRMFVLDLSGVENLYKDNNVYPKYIINPVILEKSNNLISGTEGCLSLKGVSINVNRPDYIKISFLNDKGEKEEMEAYNFTARACLHEIDHLNGVLAIDYASPLKKMMLISKLKKVYKKKK